MNKIEAADIIATNMRVFARRNSLTLTKTLAEERVSELRGITYEGTYAAEAAHLAHPRTVLRVARSRGEL